MAKCYRKESLQEYIYKFFIRLGAGFGRIRKRPKGQPSPQIYAYKKEKLQEIICKYQNGLIDLYFGDESHICTEGYVPYGRQFPGENIYIPSQKGKRLNMFGILDYQSNYHGFSIEKSITAEKVVEFPDRFLSQ